MADFLDENFSADDVLVRDPTSGDVIPINSAAPFFDAPAGIDVTGGIPADLLEFVESRQGKSGPLTPEEEAAQKAYWNRYGLKDENGNFIPGGFNEVLFRQDAKALENRYGQGSFLKSFLSLAAPLVLMAIPGIGQMIGATITGAVGIPASAAINGFIGNLVHHFEHGRMIFEFHVPIAD